LKTGGADAFIGLEEGLPEFGAEERIESAGMGGGGAEEVFGFGVGDAGGCGGGGEGEGWRGGGGFGGGAGEGAGDSVRGRNGGGGGLGAKEPAERDGDCCVEGKADPKTRGAARRFYWCGHGGRWRIAGEGKGEW